MINGFRMHDVGIPNPVITSDGAIVVNASTREIYYAKNPTKTYAPAGLTPLLTGHILLQYKGLNDVMAVTQSAVTGLESGANTVGLKAGDTITVKDALYALYIKSACDVAK
ncbi:MAG: hypothetical protein MJ151_04035, partial [Lachnospiraceae bacterium]|nr:hypothetical protein [Lachnospiraceae bacterium]